jgi:hypothetical protein
MRRALILIAVALAACHTTDVAVAKRCVPLKPYTPAEQAAVADQLDKLAQADPAFVGSPVAGMITDYKAMRDADRACIAQ